MSQHTPPANVTPLLSALRGKMLPWLEGVSMQWPLIIRRPEGSRLPPPKPLPPGCRVSKNNLKASLKATRGARAYGNQSQFTRLWRDEGLGARRSAILLTVVVGEADLPTAGWTLHCPEGTFLFILPDTPFTISSSPHLMGSGAESRSCQLLWLNRSGAGLGCWMCHSSGHRHYELPGESCYVRNHEVETLFDLLVEEAEADRENRAVMCRYLYLTLIHAICRELQAGRYYQFAHKRPGNPATAEQKGPIHEAREFIRSHLDQPLTIDFVARQVYMSRTRFTRRFRQECGMSFADFLAQCRLEESQTLLTGTEWSILLISRMVGLKPSSFRHFFQERTGFKPSEYRRLHASTKNAAVES